MEENFVPDYLLNLNHHILSQISINIGLDYDNYTYEIACIKTIAAQIERLERMQTEEIERRAKTQLIDICLEINKRTLPMRAEIQECTLFYTLVYSSD